LWLRSPSPEATFAAGRALGVCLERSGAVIGLEGPLGAGKTLFVKGLAAGLGLEPAAVASPTFVIAHEHPLPDGRVLVHVDLYRVESEPELENAGLLDWLRPGRVVVVEWSDRLSRALPAERLTLRFERDPERDSHRRLNAIASGAGAQELVARWGAALERAPDRCGLEIEARAP
jgi:tRNA threonylcarbamoyladenosine biosynthesis protein TsaE